MPEVPSEPTSPQVAASGNQKPDGNPSTGAEQASSKVERRRWRPSGEPSAFSPGLPLLPTGTGTSFGSPTRPNDSTTDDTASTKKAKAINSPKISLERRSSSILKGSKSKASSGGGGSLPGTPVSSPSSAPIVRDRDANNEEITPTRRFSFENQRSPLSGRFVKDTSQTPPTELALPSPLIPHGQRTGFEEPEEETDVVDMILN